MVTMVGKSSVSLTGIVSIIQLPAAWVKKASVVRSTMATTGPLPSTMRTAQLLRTPGTSIQTK